MRAAAGYPLATELLRCDDGVDPGCAAAIHQAVEGYHSASDAGSGFGIGYASVPVYLDVVDADPAVLLHGVGAGRYPARAAFTTATRDSGHTTVATLNGTLGLPDFGRYGTDPSRPESAPDLAQALLGSLVTSPLPAGTPVTVSALDGAGRVLQRGVVPLSGPKFSIRIPVPAGAARVVASTPGTTGVLPATVSWPVQAQQVTLMPGSGLRVSGSTVTGSYGRPFTVHVRSTIVGKAAGNVAATLTAAPVAHGAAQHPARRTNSAGTADVTAVLDRTASWRVTTADAAPTAVPAIGTTILTRVAPAEVIVKPTQHRVRAHRTTTLTGVLAGRDYRIPTAYLRPARIKVWLRTPGRRAVLLGTATSRPGGAYRLKVHPRATGTLTFDVLALAGAYAHNTAAGRVPVR